jgi:G3E family GTPase
VLVDPVRASRVFNIVPGPSFSEKILYVYRRQLEEADWIVINKSDLIKTTDLEMLRKILQNNFPKARIFDISARSGHGLTEWFDLLLSAEQGSRAAIPADHTASAEGEALLSWLNCTVRISSRSDIDGNGLLQEVCDLIHVTLIGRSSEIAHLKMTLAPDEGAGELGVVNLVRNDAKSEITQELTEPVISGSLIINLRAEGAPDLLHEAVTSALAVAAQRNPRLFARMEHLEHFRPGKPLPTHRFALPVEG